MWGLDDVGGGPGGCRTCALRARTIDPECLGWAVYTHELITDTFKRRSTYVISMP